MSVRLRFVQRAALVLAAASLISAGASAQKPTFRELKQRAQAEAKASPGRRIRTLDAIAALKSPQARRFLLDMIADEKNARVELRLVQLVARFENERVRSVLAKVLKAGKSSGLARAAAWGLVGQEKRGIADLERALFGLKKTTKSAALAALCAAARKNDAATSALLRASPKLGHDAQAQAVRALAHARNDARYERLLVALLESPSERTRSSALREYAAAKPSRVNRVIADFEEKGGGKTAKSAALFARLCSAKADSLSSLLELALEDDQTTQREIAALKRRPKLYERFVRLLSRETPKLEKAVDKLVATEMLVRMPHKSSTKALALLVEDRTTAVVLMAIEELGKREDRSTLSALRRVFDRKHPEIQLAAMHAIHGLMRKDRSWPDQLIKMLPSPKLGIRLGAIDFLGELGHEPALPFVQRYLADQRWQVRSAVYGFLSKVPSTTSVPLLIAQLDKESGRLLGECQGALMYLSGKRWPRPAMWKRWWQGNKDSFELPDEVVAEARERRRNRGKKAIAKSGKNKKGNKEGKDKKKKAGPRPSGVTYYDIPVTSKRTMFLVDTSGSMRQLAGTAQYTKLTSAKRALEQVLKLFPNDQLFNVAPFSGMARPWQRKALRLDTKNRADAIGFARALRAGGGTNIYDALKFAFDDPKIDTIYLLSDGEPSQGEITQIEELADAVRRWNRERRIVIHTISFGRDSRLLQRLAKESNGKYVRYI